MSYKPSHTCNCVNLATSFINLLADIFYVNKNQSTHTHTIPWLHPSSYIRSQINIQSVRSWPTRVQFWPQKLRTGWFPVKLACCTSQVTWPTCSAFTENEEVLLTSRVKRQDTNTKTKLLGGLFKTVGMVSKGLLFLASSIQGLRHAD